MPNSGYCKINILLQKPPDMELAEKIEDITLDYPYYGYRRITAELRCQGLKVNHKKVLRFMRNKNLLYRAIKSFKATTDSSHDLRKYPNLIYYMILYPAE